MRCDQCQKFVSFDTDKEPEDLDLNVTDDGEVSGSVRIVNACAECGQDLTETTLDVEMSFADDIEKHREEKKAEHEASEALKPEDERVSFDESEHDSVSISSSEATRSDRRQTHDRRGKLITRSRYQRQYYGAEVAVTVECKCGEDFEHSEVFEAQASSMDSLI